MNWVRASRLYELNDITNDYIASLNMFVGDIGFTRVPGFTRVSDADMERFCDRFIGKFSNLQLYSHPIPYYCERINDESLDVCMGILEEILNTGRFKYKNYKFYLLGIYKERDNTITIKYSKVIECI